jgi:hypothetical protein
MVKWSFFSDFSLKDEFPPTLQEAAEDLKNAKVHIGQLDCSEKLPDSGKTIYERFRFQKSKKGPTVFFNINAANPVTLDQKHLKVSMLSSGDLLIFHGFCPPRACSYH